jgi:hypothetical protein
MRDIEIQRASARDESINLINASGAIKTPSVSQVLPKKRHTNRRPPSITDTPHQRDPHTDAPSPSPRARETKNKKILHTQPRERRR